MDRFLQLLRGVVCLSALSWGTMISHGYGASALFMEHSWRNDLGYLWSPAALLEAAPHSTFRVELGAKPRFHDSTLNDLLYHLELKWHPIQYIGLHTGVSHHDMYAIDVGEDLVFAGLALKGFLSDETWLTLEGGPVYRVASFDGNYGLPFRFNGPVRDLFFYIQAELALNFEHVLYRFAIQSRDSFQFFRFQSPGIDQTLFFKMGGNWSFFLGFEVRLTGTFIGATTLHSTRAYAGITF